MPFLLPLVLFWLDVFTCTGEGPGILANPDLSVINILVDGTKISC